MIRPTEIPKVEILSVENSRQCPTVFHHTYTMCWLTHIQDWGWTRWRYRSLDHRSSAGNMMMMEPGEVHSSKQATGAANYAVLFLQPSVVFDAARQIGFKRVPHLKKPGLSHYPLFSALNGFYQSLTNGPSTLLEQESRLAHTIHLFLENTLEDNPKPLKSPAIGALLRTRDFICAHFDQRVTLDSLAGLAGLSTCHFLRSFRSLFGVPPHTFQIQLRVAKAKALLAQGVPPAEIDVGFADQSHLIRHFRKTLIGVTPAAYAAGGLNKLGKRFR